MLSPIVLQLIIQVCSQPRTSVPLHSQLDQAVVTGEWQGHISMQSWHGVLLLS